MEDSEEDYSNEITEHEVDEKESFTVQWVCMGRVRLQKPVLEECQLFYNGRHLTVWLNNIVYYNKPLPGRARHADLNVIYKEDRENVTIKITKYDSGYWT